MTVTPPALVSVGSALPELPPTQATRTRLPNGVEVVVAPQPALRRAHVGVYVRVGSRFETKRTNGLSHFLEHMLYRGTPRLTSAHAVNLAVESLGGSLYGATHPDFGVFSITAPPSSLEPSTHLLAEILRDPVFRDIEVEQGIVAEEILEDLDDEGRQVDADNLARELLYKPHPLGFTITGDEANVRSFDVAMLREHHARHYTGENTVVVFTGNVDPDAALRLAEATFSTLPRGARVSTAAPDTSPKKPKLRVVENASSQTELRLSLRALPQHHERRHALELLMRCVDDGMSTRLYRRVCDERGLCYDVSAYYDGYEDDGIVDFAAGCRHDRASVVTQAVLDVMIELAETGPTEAELDKAKRRQAWEADALRDAPEELAHALGTQLLFGGFELPEERVAKGAALGVEDVRSIADLVARPDRLVALAVGLVEDAERAKLRKVVAGFRGG